MSGKWVDRFLLAGTVAALVVAAEMTVTASPNACDNQCSHAAVVGRDAGGGIISPCYQYLVSDCDVCANGGGCKQTVQSGTCQTDNSVDQQYRNCIICTLNCTNDPLLTEVNLSACPGPEILWSNLGRKVKKCQVSVVP